MTDLVCNYLNLADLPPIQALAAAGAGGFRATGIRLTGHVPDNGDPGIVGDKAAIAAIKAMAAEHGIRLAAANTYRVLNERRLEDYLPVLETCAALGVAALALNCFDTDLGHAAALLALIGAEAAGLGISVGLEFIPVSTVPSLRQAAALLRSAGQPNLGINLDALHLHRSGGTPADIRAVGAGLIHSIHLCDAPAAPPEDLVAEMRAGRLFPGEGELPLHAILDAAPSGVELEIEVPNAALAALPGAERAHRIHQAGLRFLRTHAARSAAPAGL